MENIPDGRRVFDMWLEMVSKDTKDPLKPESAGPYRDIWNAWLEKLQPHGRETAIEVAAGVPTWSIATADQLAGFLAPRSVSQSGHNEHILSAVSRHRYYRVLVRIYEFACENGWVAVHPAVGLAEDDTPKRGEQTGQILPPGVWEEMPACFPDGDTALDTRDRAILALLLELALAPEEIRTMRPSDLSLASRPYYLDIKGKRQKQCRRLTVSDELKSTLQEWLVRRESHALSNESEWVFPSRRGKQMPISTLFTLVSEVVKRAALRLGIRDNSEGLMRVGPQVLRNTAIVRMVEGKKYSTDELLRILGLKNEKGLDRLRHRISARP